MTVHWDDDGLYRTPDHEYIWVEEGVPAPNVPGVTTVLKQVDKSGAFWAAASRLVAEYAVNNHEFIGSMIERDGSADTARYLAGQSRKRTQKAMATGTDVHNWAEDYAKGQLRMDEPEDHIKPYLYHFGTGFLEKYSPKFEHIEEMVYSEQGRYGGTLDLIATIDGARWLIDYKTSDKPIGSGPRQFPYTDVGLQLAALGQADFIGRESDPDKHPIPSIDHYGVVAITPDDCQLIEYDVTEAEFQVFLHYRNVHEWATTRKDALKR